MIVRLPTSVVLTAALAIACGLLDMRIRIGQVLTSQEDTERRLERIENRLDRHELAGNEEP